MKRLLKILFEHSGLNNLWMIIDLEELKLAQQCQQGEVGKKEVRLLPRAETNFWGPTCWRCMMLFKDKRNHTPTYFKMPYHEIQVLLPTPTHCHRTEKRETYSVNTEIMINKYAVMMLIFLLGLILSLFIFQNMYSFPQ